jgi:hypothetical protein
MTALRGRKPAPPSATGTEAFIKQLKGLLKIYRAEAADYQRYVRSIEKRYAAALTEIARLRGRGSKKSPAATSTIRGRGPNVRDVAYEFLRRRGDQPIQKIAAAVRKVKKGRVGANFVQNLGAALLRDKRFGRARRGVYRLRLSKGER